VHRASALQVTLAPIIAELPVQLAASQDVKQRQQERLQAEVAGLQQQLDCLQREREAAEAKYAALILKEREAAATQLQRSEVCQLQAGCICLPLHSPLLPRMLEFLVYVRNRLPRVL
jgi:uncharacterized protein YlxW (UPF0749 family)